MRPVLLTVGAGVPRRLMLDDRRDGILCCWHVSWHAVERARNVGNALVDAT